MAANPNTTVPSGTRIVGGTYEVERLLKAGGMGEVYRGRNVFNDLPVAIKIVLDSYAADEGSNERFKRESQVLATLSHDAIVRYHLYTVDPVLERPCLVMDFIPGPSLLEHMKKGPMPLEDVSTVMHRMASGLAAAHKLGVIHRDLSPDNVILQDGLVEHAKLIDFGIAKAGKVSAGTILAEGSVAGKYNYMAPEQLGMINAPVDARADIYALGLVVIGMFRGSALDMVGTTEYAKFALRQSVPDLSAVPPEMQPILARMLAPNPEDRPESMLTLIKMLDQPGYMPPAAAPKATPDTTVGAGTTTAPPRREDYAPYSAPTPPPPMMPAQDSTVIDTGRARPSSVIKQDSSDRTVMQPRQSSGISNVALDATVITGVVPSDGPRSGINAAASGGTGSAMPQGFGRASGTAPPAPRAAQAAPAAKSKGFPFAIVAVVLAAAIGGGTFFMLQGGNAPAPTTEAVATPPIKTPPVAPVEPTKQATAPAPVWPEFATQVKVMTDAAKGKCVHYEPAPGTPGPDQHWTAFTAAPDGLATLKAQFNDAFKVTPKIDVVSVVKDQCAALEFATIRGTPSATGQGISLDQKDSVVKGGAALRGAIVGSAGRATALFLISSTGAVARLDSFLTSDGKSDARFEVPVSLATDGKAVDQLLMSITTKAPVADFATLSDGYTADTVMPRLALWLTQSNQTAEIDLKPFRLEP